jgi:hypothetical protein
MLRLDPLSHLADEIVLSAYDISPKDFTVLALKKSLDGISISRTELLEALKPHKRI